MREKRGATTIRKRLNDDVPVRGVRSRQSFFCIRDSREFCFFMDCKYMGAVFHDILGNGHREPGKFVNDINFGILSHLSFIVRTGLMKISADF